MGARSQNPLEQARREVEATACGDCERGARKGRSSADAAYELDVRLEALYKAKPRAPMRVRQPRAEYEAVV